jgi:hypothetical protein
MAFLLRIVALLAAGAALLAWYRRETVSEGDALVRLQSEHEHFHLHVDLPPHMEIEPGDTVELLNVPQQYGQTPGEVSYPSRVRLTKASWLRRTLVKRSSLVEVNELVEHP